MPLISSGSSHFNPLLYGKEKGLMSRISHRGLAASRMLSSAVLVRKCIFLPPPPKKKQTNKEKTPNLFQEGKVWDVLCKIPLLGFTFGVLHTAVLTCLMGTTRGSHFLSLRSEIFRLTVRNTIRGNGFSLSVTWSVYCDEFY